MKSFFFITTMLGSMVSFAQQNPELSFLRDNDSFEQLGPLLAPYSEYRTAGGAPGHKYWQQKADYDIKCELDDKRQSLHGNATITYYNNSPDDLRFIWVQLDENQHNCNLHGGYDESSKITPRISSRQLDFLETERRTDSNGIKILKLTDINNAPLAYTIQRTLLRIELGKPLQAGEKLDFKVEWSILLINRIQKSGRCGYEYFPEDGNYLYTITQWYPRLSLYSDYEGWHNRQFSYVSEFGLEFGDFNVSISMPADYVVAATGECLNYEKNLTSQQLARWKKAQDTNTPLEIITREEAIKNEESKSASKRKTWIYKANNVRDFAWTASRKFIWDAMPVNISGNKVMCMSFYGKEAYPLYSKFSTKVIAHTLQTYSGFTLPYPYPVAQSIEAANGMEYPMICFNNGRAAKNGTYSEEIRNGMISVVIHEVGHNFFPMIINSDEREWGWMDEGVNSFLQSLTEQLWDNKYPSLRGVSASLVKVMKLPRREQDPIMKHFDNQVSGRNTAYTKTSGALTILRETILGRQTFDYAFKEYARRWAFKHPTPSDFFRTMEEASGIDLDWFWKGWFYGTAACDISLDSVRWYKADPSSKLKEQEDSVVWKHFPPPGGQKTETITRIRNRNDRTIQFATDRDTSLRDFYWKYNNDLEPYNDKLYADTVVTGYARLSDREAQDLAAKNYYELFFQNKGGLVMPVIIEWTFEDGTKETEQVSVQVWRKNEQKFSKVFVKRKQVASIQVDPYNETADIDKSNNSWKNRSAQPLNFSPYKYMPGLQRGQSPAVNPMN